MSGSPSVRILPMKTAGTHHLIERTYRESGAFQWVRETFVNAQEAGATRVEFGVEWQAVENRGVYRRTIADNGKGMTAPQLVEFFNTFGGGGKPIGDVHANFGVGAKTSLLPWNRYGIVVVSWVAGEPSMIWVRQNPETGEYGLRVLDAEDAATESITQEVVYLPFYDEEHGCDWSRIKPEWMEGQGTVIVLLGNDPLEDTLTGDPNRSEGDIKGISSYLNRRLWTVPEPMKVVVEEVRTAEKSQWPRSEAEGHGPQPKASYDRRTNRRTILGALSFIDYAESKDSRTVGKLSADGHVTLHDGTVVSWYLWTGERPHVQSYAAISGFIAALYQNELYDVTMHPATYRSFGITEAQVRSNLWLIITPPILGQDGKRGVYPRTDRNSLLLKGGPAAGEALPIRDWAAEFAENLPAEILAAVSAARGGTDGAIDDVTWRERLMERFGSRWRIAKLRVRKGGPYTVDPSQNGTTSPAQPVVRPVKTATRNGPREHGGTTGTPNTGSHSGSMPAVKIKAGGALPIYRLRPASDFSDKAMLAAWHPNDPSHPEGVVLLNVDHPVLLAEVEFWQAKYPEHLADEVAKVVLETYGQIAVAKVAHSEHLKGILPSQVVEEKLRSEEALTMALLGLVAEEAVIATRVGGRWGKQRASA